VSDSGFNGNVPTLQTQLLADDSMLQVGWVGRVGGQAAGLRGQAVRAGGWTVG